MDTRTGEIVNLNPTEAELARVRYDAWIAGLLTEKPRFIPIKKDHVPFVETLSAKQRKRMKIRSYKDYCR